MTALTAGTSGPAASSRSGAAHVIGASALGTLFEWYDFYLYGALAGTFAAHFFSGVNETTAFIFALATFSVGFFVRPLGALVFGRLGDLIGRKFTFLVTLAIMGLSTFLVGVLPDYAAIGIVAPLLLVMLRVLQGLAIGGEFSGAIVYVAEHAPAGRRGLHTSCIPAMAIGGLLLSLLVIAATRAAMTPEAFAAWGWRVPFLVSVFLLGISLWIRLRLHESPVFERMQAERRLSRAPIAETFLKGENLRLMLAALFGAVIGQAIIFYVGTFYAYYFLERVAHVDSFTVTVLTAVALVIAAPLAPLCGWLSDRIGRKPSCRGRGARGAPVLSAVGAPLSAANPSLVARRDARSSSSRNCPIARCSSIRWPRNLRPQSCDVVRPLAHAGITPTRHCRRRPARPVTGGLLAPDDGRSRGAGRPKCDFRRGRKGACRAGYAAGHPARIDGPASSQSS
jgi:MFS family permease